jgi:hypothetical protein
MTRLLFGALVVAGLALGSPAGEAHTAATGSTPSPVSGLTLPDDVNQFSGYDFRQPGFGAVDWPVEFVFRGNASVEKVKEGLCHGTENAWKYCDEGGPMYLYADEAAGDAAFTGFVANSGVKRFEENCSTNRFTAHMRLYAPKSTSDPGQHSFDSPKYGHMVIATVHLDFQDHSGCSARIHGYPDVAEQWFIEAMKTIDGWTVTPAAWDLGNASDSYVILRDLSGAQVPHVYGHDGLAADVVIG